MHFEELRNMLCRPTWVNEMDLEGTRETVAMEYLRQTRGWDRETDEYIGGQRRPYNTLGHAYESIRDD